MVSSATDHMNVARVTGSATSSLCPECIYICTWSCQPVTGTLRTGGGFTWTGVQNQAVPYTQSSLSCQSLISHYKVGTQKRHARTLICVVSPLPGGSWCLFFSQRKRNEVKDDFANFCDWCHSPTFHPLTWHMTLITINDDSDDMALLSVCGREKENPSKACSMLFRPFMGQKRLLLWWLFTDNLDVVFSSFMSMCWHGFCMKEDMTCS